MTRVTFPTRRTGLIHIRGRLQLKSGKPLIEISFRREDFQMLPQAPTTEHLGYLACSVHVQLMRAAGEYAFRRDDPYWGRIIDTPLPQKLRRGRLTLHETYEHDPESETRQPTLNYTIKISRQDLALVDQDGTGASREISLLLSDPELHEGLQAGRRRPRGARARASVMLRPVRFALLEAQRICTLAQADITVRARVERALGEDFDPDQWQQNAVMLVSRAFRGAWAKYHVKDPAARTEGDAGDVYRQLLPAARKRAILASFRKAPTLPPYPTLEWIHQNWEKHLLGPVGAAAREWDLI